MKYKAIFERDPDGGFVVTFPDIPEALTRGKTMREATDSARDALSLSLRCLIQEGRAAPIPTATSGYDIWLMADLAMKLELIKKFRNTGITEDELAKWIEVTESELKLLLDPHHPSEIKILAKVLKTLDKKAALSS